MIKILLWTSYIFMWSFAGIYLMPGIQTLGELLFFLVAALCLIRFWKSTKDVVILCIFIILFMHLLRITINAFEGIDLTDIFRNSHRIFLYFIPIIFAITIRNNEDVKQAVRIAAWILLISAISYFIVRVGISDLGYLVEEDPGTGALRIRHIVFEFIYIFGILFLALSLSSKVRKNKAFYLFLYIISLAVIVDSYFRTFLLGFLFCTVIVFLLSVIKDGGLLKKSLKTLIIIGFGGSIILSLINPSVFWERISGQLIDEVQMQSGTFLSRIIIWDVRENAVVNDERLAIGYGFVTSKEEEEQKVADRILNPRMMDSDNGYASILVAYGVMGFIIFGVFYFLLLVDSIKFYKTYDNEFSAIVITVIAVLFSNILLSFFKDFFLWVYSVLSFGLLIGIYLAIKRITVLSNSTLKV